MDDRTTVMFALPGFRVLDVTEDDAGGRLVLVETVATEGGCPSCGVLSSRIKDRPTSRAKDLPHGVVPLRLWVRKRRYLCAEELCSRRSFTETSAQLPARSRLTTRLRVKVSAAVTTTNRAMSEVAKDYGVAWWTVHRILVAAAAAVLGPAAPTTMIGIDETRARSVRWLREEANWRRSDPWMTSIVDLDPSHPGGIIGLAPGRSGACVWRAGSPCRAASSALRCGSLRSTRAPPTPPGSAALCPRPGSCWTTFVPTSGLCRGRRRRRCWVAVSGPVTSA